VDNSETRARHGVGLGLYIVKKVVELLEGTIVIDSRVREGSTFTVQIPCAEVSTPSLRPMLPFAIQAEA
jgi:signal transduction histidine kinase